MPVSASGPVSVPDDLADPSDEMVRRNVLLQAPNDPLHRGGAEGSAADADRLPIADWMAQRTQEIAEALNPPGGPDGWGRYAVVPGGNRQPGRGRWRRHRGRAARRQAADGAHAQLVGHRQHG